MGSISSDDAPKHEYIQPVQDLRKTQELRGTATHYIVLIRHGERGDAMPDFDVKNSDDAALTPQGIIQARETGKHLRDFFSMNGLSFDKVMVESSPFVRTLMTAGQIASQLKVPEVQVNYELTEGMLDGPEYWDFTENPMPIIEWTKAECDAGKLREEGYELPENVNFTELSGKFDLEYKAKIFKAYPEVNKTFSARNFESMKRMSQRCLDLSENGTKSICYIGVSHGFHIDQYCHILDSCAGMNIPNLLSMTPQQDKDVLESVTDVEYGQPGYCAITGFLINQQRGQSEKLDKIYMTWRRENAHVSPFYTPEKVTVISSGEDEEEGGNDDGEE